MTLDQVLAFIAFSVAAAGTPGPSNALLTATGANVGVKRSFSAVLDGSWLNSGKMFASSPAVIG